MRASLYVVLTIVAAAAVPRLAAAQKPFEGSITYDIVGGDQQMALTVTTRGAKARQWLDNPAAPEVSRANYQLVDFTTGEAMYVIPAMETYMVTKLKGFADAPSDEPPATRAADIVATARQETIAGLRCTVYVQQSKPGNEWCLTSGRASAKGADLGDLSGETPAIGGGMPGLFRAFLRGTVVLRSRLTDRNGRTMTMIATKVDRATPPASLFEVPAGFQEVRMSAP